MELELDGRFRFVDRIVNVDRLRAYKTRWGTGADILAADPTTEALCQDPRGGTWWEVEDVVATRNGKTKNGRRQVQYLVRYKGFSEAYDEWKAEKDVSQALVQGYKALVKAAKAAGG